MNESKGFKDFQDRVERGRKGCIASLREKGLPVAGWQLEHYWDAGDAGFVCSVCGNDTLRYIFKVSHPRAPADKQIQYVGSVCVAIMTGEVETTYQIDTEFRKKVQQKKYFENEFSNRQRWEKQEPNKIRKYPAFKYDRTYKGCDIWLFHDLRNPEKYVGRVTGHGKRIYVRNDDRGEFYKTACWKRLCQAVFDTVLELSTSEGSWGQS